MSMDTEKKQDLKRLGIIFLLLTILLCALFLPAQLKRLNNQMKLSSAPDYIQNFSGEQAQEDFDFFWATLEDNFPYLQMHDRLSDVSAGEIREKYQAQIRDDISFNEFYEMMFYCAMEFNSLGHLAIFFPDFYESIVQTISDLYDEFGSYPFHYAALTDPKAVETYEYLKQVDKQKMYQRATTAGGQSLTTITEGEENTFIIKISSFLQEFTEEDEKKLLAAYEQHQDKDAMIIDIRGNGGGSDLYWMDLLVSPNITEETLSESIYMVMNDNFIDPAEYYTDFSEIEKLPEINKEDLALFNFWQSSHYSISPLNENEYFDGDIYVLVDGRVGSAAEGFAIFCKSTGFATLIGEQTGGDGAGGINPMYSVLPNSGLLMSYRITYGLNPDGSSNTEFGTTPDYIVPGSDALEKCYALIKEKNLPTN